ncbi:MAG: hypothetical protein HYX27_18045 [Acidobacteria bacterium]|nr:hypothetical protein [Acidobacteriota bacterium]
MISAALLAGLALQLAQNPSPMTDATRRHERITQKPPAGHRKGRAVIFGQPGPASPIIIHFHGDSWLPEQAIASVYTNVTVIAIQAGNGSDSYQDVVKSPEVFQALLAEAGAANTRRPVILTSFSAGYGAIRAILRHSYKRIDSILLMDGLHAGYQDHDADPADLNVFLQFAKEAALGRKRMLITHSEVFPGTFASTTETSDWLLHQLRLRRVPVLRWGPVGMQQLSDARRGRLAILGFAGNSAPDHVDHFHGMATWLRALRRM